MNTLIPMNIIHIIPGSGGTFYCQNCLRDNILVKGLRDAGHNVTLIPLYLPMFSDNPDTAENSPVFFGAVSIYLKYKFPVLSKLTNCIKPLLNASPLLRWVARKSESVKPNGLEGMTIAMLNGDKGPMADELNTLISWLEKEEHPDIIHISNPLLLGLVETLKNRLCIPIVCSLQDEDQWLDKMVSPYKEQIWQIMSEKSQYVDAFTAVSEYYGNVMRKKLKTIDEKIHIVPIGMDFTDYYSPAASPPSSPIIGFLSKISEDLGFTDLTNAVLEIKKDDELRNLKLYATGGLIGEDIKYVDKIKKRFTNAGFSKDIIIQTEFDRASRINFLQSLSLLSVPIPEGEAFGTYLIEAMAAGTPVVQPNAGAFPEIVRNTGGGIVYDSNDPNALINTLKSLLLEPNKAKEIGEKGRKAVLKHYSIDTMVTNTLKVYSELLSKS